MIIFEVSRSYSGLDCSYTFVSPGVPSHGTGQYCYILSVAVPLSLLGITSVLLWFSFYRIDLLGF